jgi:hypothetical protein
MNNINQDLIHYCIDSDRYTSNINWINNPDFKPYKIIAPQGIDNMDFVPL